MMHHFKTTLARCLLLAGMIMAVPQAGAQTSVPKLDLEGRRGDVARLANQRALERFNAADADHDGKLSRAEVEKNFPYLAEKFTEHDKDGDGFISWEEYVGHNRWPR